MIKIKLVVKENSESEYRGKSELLAIFRSFRLSRFWCKKKQNQTSSNRIFFYMYRVFCWDFVGRNGTCNSRETWIQILRLISVISTYLELSECTDADALNKVIDFSINSSTTIGMFSHETLKGRNETASTKLVRVYIPKEKMHFSGIFGGSRFWWDDQTP